MKLLACTALVTALALVGSGCTDDNPLAGACGSGFDPQTGAVGDFGTDQAALKVEAFLAASGALYGASIELESDVLGACTAIATDLGIPAAELAPGAGELAVAAACRRVVEEIDGIVATLPAGVALGISVAPASCTVDLDVAASCAGACDVTIEGDATVACQGELHGACSGSCTGSCSVEGTVTCAASCSGTCTGSCSGTCTGTCTGTCSVEDTAGNCVGTCTGTCTGTCSADCTGSCSGTCTSDVTAACQGECYGTCDATWDAECNGAANVTADADCKAACDARANATATCTAPDVTVVFVGDVPDLAEAARIAELVLALEAHYPALLSAQHRMQFAIVPSLQAFVASVRGAATSLASVGVQASACLAVAVDAVVESAARIDASVSVSIEVSASVSASGSAS